MYLDARNIHDASNHCLRITLWIFYYSVVSVAQRHPRNH